MRSEGFTFVNITPQILGQPKEKCVCIRGVGAFKFTHLHCSQALLLSASRASTNVHLPARSASLTICFTTRGASLTGRDSKASHSAGRLTRGQKKNTYNRDTCVGGTHKSMWVLYGWGVDTAYTCVGFWVVGVRCSFAVTLKFQPFLHCTDQISW